MSTELNKFPLFDICEAHHRGNENSRAANLFIVPKKQAMQEQIHSYITSCGRRGATCHEVCAALKLRWPTASARLSEMKRTDGRLRIFWNGQKRSTDGSMPASVFVTSQGQLK